MDQEKKYKFPGHDDKLTRRQWLSGEDPGKEASILNQRVTDQGPPVLQLRDGPTDLSMEKNSIL